jgi:hypothetical protein
MNTIPTAIRVLGIQMSFLPMSPGRMGSVGGREPLESARRWSAFRNAGEGRERTQALSAASITGGRIEAIVTAVRG